MKTAISTLIGSTLLATSFIGLSAIDAHALDCNNSSVTLSTTSFTACEGAFSGNDTGNGTLINELNDGSVFGSYGLFDAGEDLWDLDGKSDGDGGNYGFTANNGSTDSTWSLTKNLQDLFGDDLTATFAVSFKASNKYSVYLFEDFKITQAELDAGRVDGTFTTNGVSVNGRGKAQALSHGSFWTYSGEEEEYNPPNEVPEPSAALALGLVAAGMFGIKKKVNK